MKAILTAILSLRDRTKKYDDKLSDPRGDGSYEDNRSPDGNDYNELYNDVMHTVQQIEAIQVGRLWWSADTDIEFIDEIARLTHSGASFVKVWREGERIHYIFEMVKANAKEILGYEPDPQEWLIEESEDDVTGSGTTTSSQETSDDELTEAAEPKFVTFSMDIKIDDEPQFRQRAYEQATKDGLPPEEAAEYLDAELKDIAECVQMVFDTGLGPIGSSILGSTAEESLTLAND
jgi:hypothetical protein